MAQISRKELKSDEFVSGMDAAYEFYLQHQKSILVLVVVVAVVVGTGWGFYAWRTSRNQAANRELAQALNILHAPVAASGAQPGVTTFPNEAARAFAATKQLQDLVARYGSTESGKIGSYYMGLVEASNDQAGGEQKLKAEAASSDPIASVAAKHALANLYIQQNKPQQARTLLLELTKQDSTLLPRSVALLELAELDRTLNPKEAEQYYRQLQADYPGTATAQQAQQEMAALH